jgi:nitrogen-specific signal transduction histidine kinase/DNA-binding NarL/FixJ family response regulator
MLMDEIEAHKRTDAALQKAKEVAEAANVAKTRYIVGISHEIRSPLNAIFGYAQLLERGLAGPSDNAARVIRRSAEHLTNLVDGLLDISRIENGMLRLNRDRVQLVEFLDQIVDMFRLQAANRDIEFRYQRPPHLPAHVYTDQKRLRQILINLLSNAIKYTERGHASLVVRYRNQVAEFEISDTGVGIAAADLERVFQPFERGETPTVRAIPGIGLGLTITKLLTQIMGGELLARSTLGQGTTFTVRLLLSEAMHAVHQPSVPGRITGYEGARLKLLLIDDDPSHLDMVQRLLQPLQFDVITAPNGRTGLALAAERCPALVMIDISMPDLSGWEVARQLREQAELRSMKIVMVSANAHEYSPGGADYAHDSFVMKPVDLHVLLECITGLLGLQCTYEPEPQDAIGAVCELPAGSRHHVNDLYQLGKIGHVRGIQAKLRQIESDDPASKPFTTHLQALVANFDLKRFMNVLETMRNDDL